MTTRALLIRHGETDWNATGRWQGNAPVPLNDAGLAQARALATYLAAQPQRIDVLYSSPLPRARQSAQAIADALRLPVLTDERLREVDLGDWQGLSRVEVEAWDAERFAAYQADWYNMPIPNGESRRDLQARARAAFDDITARHPGGTIGIVSHGGTLGMLIESLLGPIERPSLSNTSLTVLEQTAPGAPWEPVAVGLAPHLDDLPLGETW
jgi:probable phosphoglycerate mutase